MVSGTSGVVTEYQVPSSACACPDPRLWGKEHGLQRAYPVLCHMLDVAAVFGVLWDVLLSDTTRKRFAGQLESSPHERR